jgi:hypothetical protein
MLKIAGLSFGADGLRVSGKCLFPYRPVSGSDECQHADMAKSRFGEGGQKHSALYFCVVGDDAKESDGRGSVHARTEGVAEG